MKWFKRQTISPEQKYYALGKGKSKYEIKFSDGEETLINKKKVKIEIIEGNDGFTDIIYNNKKYLAEIIEKNQNKYHVLINGVSYFFTIETPISYKRKKNLNKIKTTATSKSIIAPMPGKIVDIMVEEDNLIKKGDSLLILEAMKMQNEILSDVSGRIVKINVNEEDTVSKDAVLMEVK